MASSHRTKENEQILLTTNKHGGVGKKKKMTKKKKKKKKKKKNDHHHLPYHTGVGTNKVTGNAEKQTEEDKLQERLKELENL